MTTTTDTEAALLAAVFSNPDDDTARLVYADYLDENAGWLPGRDPAEMRARAEFIRVQCGLVSAPSVCSYACASRIDYRCKWCELRARESALLKQWGAAWRRVGECPECYRKVNILTNEPLPQECKACGGTRDAGGLLREFRYHHDDYDHDGPSEPVRVRLRRGWLDAVEVPRLEDVLEEVPCPICDNPGFDTDCGLNGCNQGVVWQPTRWARALRAHRSLTRVVAAELDCNGGAKSFLCDDALNERYSLPKLLFETLYKLHKHKQRDGRWLYFDTREAAIDAAAVAVCEVIRG